MAIVINSVATVLPATPGRILKIPWPLWMITLIFAVHFAIDGIAEPRF
jgi:hypothetical protein